MDVDRTGDQNEEDSGGKKSKRQQYYADSGVPWVTAEAIASVLKGQIECVIKLGAHASVKVCICIDSSITCITIFHFLI